MQLLKLIVKYKQIMEIMNNLNSNDNNNFYKVPWLMYE